MLERVVNDLRERRLWPVAIVLLVAIVAVPFVLAKSPSSPSVRAPLTAGTGVQASLPSVTVSTTPPASDLRSRPRDPFTQPRQAKITSTTTSAVTAGASGSNGAKSSSTSSSSSTSATNGGSGGSGSGGSSNSSGGPATKIPTGHAKPAPSGLGARQTYAVTLAATRPDGGLDTTASLLRLSPVPRANQPLLVELGVLKGGRRVLFAVLPGTNFSGPGSCTPGPVDCEVLSLGVNQVETVWGSDPNASTEFAVTAIGVDTLSSRAAAAKARAATSAQGRRLLAAADLTAPTAVFSYDANLGALVDLRNLSGGN